MQKKRRSEISALNTLFCLLVVFIHAVSYPIGAFSPETSNYTIGAYSAFMIPWRLASFVVQGFILLAGVKAFLTGKDNVPYPKYIKGRLLGVILPYFLSFVAYYAFYMLVYDYPLDFSFIIPHLFLGSLVCHYYFIPLLFQFDLLMPLWKRIVNSCSAVFIIPAAVLLSAICESYFPTILSIINPEINFPYNDRIVTTYLAFWLIGCYIGKNYDLFAQMLKKNLPSVSVIYGIALCSNVYFSYLAYNSLAYVPFMNLVHYFYTLATIVFLYAVFLTLPEGTFEKIPFAKSIDKASYHIYLMHMLAIFGTNFLLDYLGLTEPVSSFFVRLAIVYVVTASVCILYINIKGMLGKKLKRS